MGFLEDLTPEQLDVVEELKERTIKDVTPKMLEDPTLFYRFAKARDFNLKQAEAMLRKHILFRKEYDYDNILTNYNPPEVLLKYTPTNFIGYDNDGHPVRYVSISETDVKGIIKSVKRYDIIKFNLYITESDVERLKHQSKKLGKEISKIVYIYDYNKLSFAMATHKETIELMMLGANIYQDNYPERIHSIYLINSSIYLSMLLSIVKAVLAASILEKMNIFGTSGFQEKLCELMPEKDLPAFLGGKRTDPDGNPLCETFIIKGGKIPERYYMQKSKKTFYQEPGVKKLYVTRFSSESISFDVVESGSYLEWQFETKNRDIGFSIYYKEKSWDDSELVEIIPKHRFDTCIEPETGVYKCEKVGTYVMVFDNSYSWFYPKEIYYKAAVVPPNKMTEL